jgi:transcriptional regulator with XRE-family HTH domain
MQKYKLPTSEQIRKLRKVSVIEAAEKSGLTRSMIYRIEKGADVGYLFVKKYINYLQK